MLLAHDAVDRKAGSYMNGPLSSSLTIAEGNTPCSIGAVADLPERLSVMVIEFSDMLKVHSLFNRLMLSFGRRRGVKPTTPSDAARMWCPRTKLLEGTVSAAVRGRTLKGDVDAV